MNLNPQIDQSYFEKFMPTIISLIVTGLLSVIIGVYLEKFKNKLTLLKYKIFFQPLATTSQTDYWGDISVTHNNRKVNHLSFVTVEIQNDSNRDIENINVDTCVDNLSQFLGVSGIYKDSNNYITLEQTYYNYYIDVSTRTLNEKNASESDPYHIDSPQLKNELLYVQTNKKFHLPVFNRHSSIKLHLLIENYNGLIPTVSVSVLHKSVKLILETDSDSERKQTTIWMFSIGLIIFMIGFLFLLKYYSDSTTPLILSALLGLSYSLLGLGIYQFGRYIKRILS